MKNFLVALITVICVGFAAGSVLYATGIVDFDELLSGKTEEKEASFYVRFMDDFFLIDEDGLVLGSSLNEPMDIPEIKDMMFYSITKGTAACAADEKTFEYVREVCSLLDAYSIYVSYICVSEDGQLTLYLTDDLSVMLGDDEDTAVKIKDLCSLYSKLVEYEGVLYMQNADTSGFGYTFKLSDGV